MMKEIQYITLKHHQSKFSMSIFKSNMITNVVVEENITKDEKLKEVLKSFPTAQVACIICVFLKEDCVKTDPLFHFIKENLPHYDIIQRTKIPSDIVYTMGKQKHIIFYTKNRWREIQENTKDIHTGDPKNGKILATIYEIKNYIPLQFVSSMNVKTFLPDRIKQQFINLHNTSNINPTIKWCSQNQRLYKINNYPMCVLKKLCPLISDELASIWAHSFVSLFSVLFFVCNKYEYIIDCSQTEDFFATLNWKDGLFITNKHFSNDNKNVTFITEISEPHLITRWSYPELSSVVGQSGRVYYGLNDVDTLNRNILCEKGICFISKLLHSCTWYKSCYKETNIISDQCEMLRNIFEFLFNESIFEAVNDSMSLVNKLSDLSFVHNNRLYIHYTFGVSKKENMLRVEPVESFFELFITDLCKGQEVTTNGFLLHMRNILYTTPNKCFDDNAYMF